MSENIENKPEFNPAKKAPPPIKVLLIGIIILLLLFTAFAFRQKIINSKFYVKSVVKKIVRIVKTGKKEKVSTTKAITLQVTGNRVRIRQNPSLESKILGHLNQNDSVIHVPVSANISGNWKRVTVKGKELSGWVNSDYLK